MLVVFASLNAIDGICCPDGCTHEEKASSTRPVPRRKASAYCVPVGSNVPSSDCWHSWRWRRSSLVDEWALARQNERSDRRTSSASRSAPEPYTRRSSRPTGRRSFTAQMGRGATGKYWRGERLDGKVTAAVFRSQDDVLAPGEQVQRGDARERVARQTANQPGSLNALTLQRPVAVVRHSVRVGRIEAHDNQRDVVVGITLIGTSKQLLRSRLRRRLGVESCSNCSVRQHLC